MRHDECFELTATGSSSLSQMWFDTDTRLRETWR